MCVQLYASGCGAIEMYGSLISGDTRVSFTRPSKRFRSYRVLAIWHIDESAGKGGG